MIFDREEGSEFLRLIPGATLFPLVVGSGLPAGAWGALEAGEKVQAEDPRQGYGIATGARSGGLVVLDVDTKGGKAGPATLAALEARWGALPRTLTVSSPSGGTHLYFTHPGAFQSNVEALGPGLDVRAEGGYVRIPGSPHPKHPDVFRLARAVAPAMLPATWADRLPRAGAPGAPAPAQPDAPPVPPDELRARLAETAKGRRGPVWAAWRSIAQGERFVRVRGGAFGPPVPDPYGGIDDFLSRGLLHGLASTDDWGAISADAMIELIRPSLAILIADDRAAGNPVYSEQDVRGKWDRARTSARTIRAQNQAADAFAQGLVERVQGVLPLVVCYTGAFYVRRPTEQAYVGPKLARDLWITARDLWTPDGPDVYRPTKGGPVRMSTDDLAERHGVSVDRVVHDTNALGPRIEARTLVLPAAQIAREAREHADVARWLAAYDPTEHLHDWIAVVTDLGYAAPALWLTGEGGIGKSLLAAGLARIWDATPTPMARAFAEFNDAILRCPLVEAAEEIPRNHRGYQDVEKLKDLITETERKINEKHKPIRDVLGAVRVVLSSNNTNLIHNAADLTAEDARALADRFVHLHVTPEHATRVRAALPPPRTIQDEWIGGGRLAEHALWLVQTRTVPFGPRLRMRPCSEGLRQMFVTQPGAGGLVCAAVYAWILQAARALEAGGQPVGEGLLWHAGAVHATADAVEKRLPQDAQRPSRRSIAQTLKRFALGSERVLVDGQRLWPIDTAAVRSWVESEGWGDPGDLDRAIKVLDGRAQTR